MGLKFERGYAWGGFKGLVDLIGGKEVEHVLFMTISFCRIGPLCSLLIF